MNNIHLAQELGNKYCTCSAPGRGPCLQYEPLMSGWWRWGQGGCTLVLPCQATECSDTGPRCAHLASLLGSPSDPRTLEHTCDSGENTMQTLHLLFMEDIIMGRVHQLYRLDNQTRLVKHLIKRASTIQTYSNIEIRCYCRLEIVALLHFSMYAYINKTKQISLIYHFAPKTVIFGSYNWLLLIGRYYWCFLATDLRLLKSS